MYILLLFTFEFEHPSNDHMEHEFHQKYHVQFYTFVLLRLSYKYKNIIKQKY